MSVAQESLAVSEWELVDKEADKTVPLIVAAVAALQVGLEAVVRLRGVAGGSGERRYVVEAVRPGVGTAKIVSSEMRLSGNYQRVVNRVAVKGRRTHRAPLREWEDLFVRGLGATKTRVAYDHRGLVRIYVSSQLVPGRSDVAHLHCS